MKHILLLYLTLIIFPHVLKAQYYDIGQEPWSIKWGQVNTPNFKVIYPSNYHANAISTALLLERWRLPVARSLKVIPPYTPVILHTGNVYSNAFSIWAPRRIEFLTTPPQDIYGQGWLEQLTIHEFRHIVQISKVNQGFTKALGAVFGQQAAPAILGLFVPPWFMEGDAVATETALTHTGRGRVADFAMPLRAQLIEKGQYSYAKATLGSYNDFIPNEYITGYHIVATAREKYGIEIWNSALNRTGRKPYTLNPFSKGIKQVSGKNKRRLYEESMFYLDSLWHDNVKNNYNLIKTRTSDIYSNYTHPYRVGGKLIVLRNSLDDIHRFVTIDPDGKETIIYTPGFLYEDEISFNGKWITWIEEQPHPRWQNQGYSTIFALDPITKDVIKIKTKLRLFAPAMSPDSKYLACSEMNSEGRNFLSIIDLNGIIINRFPAPAERFISSPSWSSDGKQIVMILTGNTGKEIAILNSENQEFNIISSSIPDQISDPCFAGESILFNLDINEKSEICSLNLSNGVITQVTESRYGTSHSYYSFTTNTDNATNGVVLFSSYTADGYRPAEITLPLKPQQGLVKEISFGSYEDPATNNHWPLASTLGEQEISLAQTVKPEDTIQIAKYPKTANLINLHSWGPVYLDIEDQTANPGISFMSQNLLSTLFVTAGYDFDLNEATGRWKADVSWRGWFPVITTGISHGKRAYIPGSDDNHPRFTWNETSWDFAISQWLRGVNGRFSKGIGLSVMHQYMSNSNDNSTPNDFRDGRLGVLNYSATAFILSKSAYRQLAPPLGVRIDLHFKNSIFGDYTAGDMYSAQTRIFLPGLAKTHSLQLYTAYQELNISDNGYRFSEDIGLPEGYNYRIPEYMIRIRPSYSFPVAYPDAHSGTTLYLKRFRSSVFFDYAAETAPSHQGTYRSAGIDLIFDYHFFSLPAPITLGLRYSYLLDEEEMNFSFIVNWDFTQY